MYVVALALGVIAGYWLGGPYGGLLGYAIALAAAISLALAHRAWR